MGKLALSKKAHGVCFLDYRLGAQTGLDLLKEVIPEDCKIPIILLTGYGEHEVDLESMRIGAADYLIKDQMTAVLLERSIRYSIHRTQSRESIGVYWIPPLKELLFTITTAQSSILTVLELRSSIILLQK